ncbi:hypothetical protein Pint_04816 [Pistacia integerrima]|uniref:Uncharacterized protein n=1 Tax=Pistacia integerrima TaxID=434235 RepID=A0ACC0Z7E5_9ROSI|nr:hypothetical protein Pint_04816 [Pistacia integerrima]
MEEQTPMWNQTPLTLRQLNPADFCELSGLEGGVYVLNLTEEFQRRLTLEAIRLIDKLLDQVAGDVCAYALITTNQLFCLRVGGLIYADTFGAVAGIFATVSKACQQAIDFCIPTLAIITGHAVGAGYVFSLAHDYRLMSTTHGYIFMNEADLGMSLTPGNMAVLHSKLPVSTFQEAVLAGKRYNGKAAAAVGIVHAAFPSSVLLQKGIKKAMEHKARNWNRKAYQALKMEMYKTTVQELESGGVGFARSAN